MFIVTWFFDKLGYMPKVTIDTNWSFPVAKKVAKKTVNKATTRPKKK
jgi:hypothetical protein